MPNLKHGRIDLRELLKALPEPLSGKVSVRDGVTAELVITANMMRADIEFSKVDFKIVLKGTDEHEETIEFDESISWSELPTQGTGEAEWALLTKRIMEGEDPDHAYAAVLFERFSKDLKLDIELPNGPEEDVGFYLTVPWRETPLLGEYSFSIFLDYLSLQS